MLVHLWIRNHVRMVVRCMGKGCCYCEGKSIAPYDLPSSLATGFAAPAPSFGPAMPSIGPSRRGARFMPSAHISVVSLFFHGGLPMMAFGDRSHEWSKYALEPRDARSEEHTSELQSLMRISYAVFCLKKNTPTTQQH